MPVVSLLIIGLTLIAVDPSLGRVDKSSFSQKTLMEILTSSIKGCLLQKTPIDPPMSPDWVNTELDDAGNIKQIWWQYRNLGESLDMYWIPSTTEIFVLDENKLQGSVDLTVLPPVLRGLNLRENEFGGTVDLTQLPIGLRTLDISSNQFVGEVNLTKLPQTLTMLWLSRNDFEGETDFGNLPDSLEDISLSYTKLSGEIRDRPFEMIAVNDSGVTLIK